MIFDRTKYKDFARKQLRKRWTVPALITLTIFLVFSIFSIPNFVTMFKNHYGAQLLDGNFENFIEFLNLFRGAVNFNTPPLVMLAQLLASAIFEVASLTIYLKMSRSPEEVHYSDFISGLQNWGKAIVACLLQVLWIFLWSLLFLLPGFVKLISYSQTYFIISEYDEISVKKAMKISSIITRGHKMDLFITFLSFIGWYILGVVTCGVAMIWVKPYAHMTFINAYHAMMKDALEIGTIRPEDLQ
ncbi:MAG: DUF975 family protein [Treponema sp.]|nr:DUF975 family protein [Treponema sp.]